MQLLVFDLPAPQIEGTTRALAHALTSGKSLAVMYADCNDPHGVGLLTWSEIPRTSSTHVRPLFSTVLAHALLRHDFAMLGRHTRQVTSRICSTRSSRVPFATSLDAKHPWHVWYPLRRWGEFARLDPAQSPKRCGSTP